MGSRSKRTALAVLAVCALAGGACTAQEAQPQSIVVTGLRGTSAWIRAESAHVVVSNAARADVARLVEHIERLDALLRMQANDSRDPAMAAWAVQFQRRLDAGLTQAAIVDEMRKGLDGGGNEWTFDLVGLIKDVESEGGMEYARGAVKLEMQKEISKEMQRSVFKPPADAKKK